MTLSDGTSFGNVFLGENFSPIPTDGMQLWLDASDANMLYDSVSGGNIVSSNGANVKRWIDKSGNNFSATEDTNCPTLVVNAKNGLNGLDFSSEKYLTGLMSGSTITAQIVFCVLRWNATASAGQRIFTQAQTGQADSNGFIPIVNYNFLGSNYIDSYGGGFYRYGNTGPAATNNSFYIVTCSIGGGTSSMAANLTSVSGSFSISTTVNNYRLCANINSSLGTNSGSYGNSLLCEVVVYNKLLTLTEISAVKKYLNDKWAVY